MFRLTLRTLRAHARRLTSTLIAVTVGVAFLVGVLVMVATFQRGFDDMFATGTEGTDVVVRSADGIDLGFGDSARGEIAADTVERVATVDGVRAVAPIRSGTAQIEGADGDVVGGGGPPQEGAQWITDEALNPWVLQDGRAPAAPDEVVIDAASARQGGLEVGAETRVFTPEPVPVRVVGIARFGTAESQGPLTTALFDEAGAVAHLGGTPGTVDAIVVAGIPGTDQAELAERVGAALPDDVEAITGAAYAEEAARIGQDFVGVIRPALLAFAGLALVIGAFSIYNTFAILVAQRTRESALLRAIGASRRQILRATVGEAVAIGLLGSVTGLVLGIALAAGLGSLISGATGLGSAALVVGPATVAAAVVTGVGVTVTSALLPARRASKVPPVAALRAVAAESGAVGRGRTIAAAAIAAVGLAVGGQAALTDGGAARAGFGAFALLLAVIVAAPALAGPLVRMVGAPLTRLRGVSGVLARRNAVRSPRRTGATATALVIGVAVVALFSVIAASVQRSFDDIIDEQIAGDVLVQSADVDGIGGIAPSLIDRLERLPESDAVVGIGGVPATLDGSDRYLSFADPASLAEVIDLGVAEGAITDMGPGTIALSVDAAERRALDIGDTVALTHADGVTEDLTLVVTYTETALATDAWVDTATAAAHVPGLGPNVVLLSAAPGVTAERLDDAAEAAAEDWPGLVVQTRDEFAEAQARAVESILMVIYVLLALSVGIALMGIGNTISLSTLERRHELGLLRAVGQTRAQVRSMVRWEAVLIALVGTVAGLVVGIGAAWMVIAALSGDLTGFAVPWATVAVIALIGAAAGVLASARPARRAARIPVLDAISGA